ncbi:MAG: hypothetical protein JSS72_05190 [Armatimonadetes bacterium]|nr:hypothetical protein [Armatimonadota bacterium]
MPALVDQLHRANLVKDVGDLIHSCEPPQVFGVSGDWGSGKTSFLRQLQRYISGECGVCPEWKPTGLHQRHPNHENVIPIWFEAWRYEHESLPVIALLHEIREQLSIIARTKNELKKIGEVSIRAALAILDKAGEGIKLSGLTKVQGIGEKWEADRYYTPLSSEAIRKQLEYAIDQLLGNKKAKASKRLVILVDDLDRCEPSTAFRLLEGMKVYLNLSNCVFVLGMNQSVVELGIAQLYKDLPGIPNHMAKEYLEKICQNVWHLPVGGFDPQQFLEATLPMPKLTNDSPKSEVLRHEFFSEALAIVKEFDFLPRNARRIKAFANVIDRISKCYQGAPAGQERKDEVSQALIFAYLYQYCQPIYRILQVNKDFYGTEVVEWLKSPKDPRSLVGGGPIRARHPAFANIEPIRAVRDDKGAIPADDTMADLFVDPASEGFIRIQGLILRYQEITNSVYNRYLTPW